MTTSLSNCFVFCILLFIDIFVQCENIREYFWRCTKLRQPCDCVRPSVDAAGDNTYFPKNTVMRSACDILNCMCFAMVCVYVMMLHVFVKRVPHNFYNGTYEFGFTSCDLNQFFSYVVKILIQVRNLDSNPLLQLHT